MIRQNLVIIKEEDTIEDLTNKKFGRLLVLGVGEPFVNKNGQKSKRWLCKCDCGNMTNVRTTHLKNGAIKSCGCITKERLHDKCFNDLTGKKFNKLYILERAEDYINPQGKPLVMWKCRCDCGNEIVTRGASILSGLTTSCGCVQKEKARENGLKYKRNNVFDLSQKYGMGFTHGNKEEFYFDLEDFDKIKDLYWTINNHGYVVSNDINKCAILFHRLILDIDDSYEVDHINHNTKDNRKENLRIVSRSQNQMNTRLRKDNTSGVKGVYFDNTHNYWVAKIQNDVLGCFYNFDEAVKVRKNEEEKRFGEYSYDNNINRGE